MRRIPPEKLVMTGPEGYDRSLKTTDIIGNYFH
jgi:hypothetical protein